MFYYRYYYKDNIEILGSDGSGFIRLKTLKGAINRLNNYCVPAGAVKRCIYKVNDIHDNNLKLVDTKYF